MRAMPAGFFARLDRLIDSGVLAWAVAIELTSGAAIYLTNANRAFTRNGQTYLPFPIKLGDLADSGEGDLPTTTVTLSNVGRMPMPYLEGESWKQARVIIELAYLPDQAAQLIRVDGFIQSATATTEAVTLNLGQPNYFDQPFPGRRWNRAEQFPGIPRNVH